LHHVGKDNNASLLKVTNTQFLNMTPRMKHIVILYDWFKEIIKEVEIKAQMIDTKVQKADIFTKGIVTKEFEEKCTMLIMGCGDSI
jgi:hypothetical protein